MLTENEVKKDVRTAYDILEKFRDEGYFDIAYTDKREVPGDYFTLKDTLRRLGFVSNSATATDDGVWDRTVPRALHAMRDFVVGIAHDKNIKLS